MERARHAHVSNHLSANGELAAIAEAEQLRLEFHTELERLSLAQKS
jgi:hypothetical protein